MPGPFRRPDAIHASIDVQFLRAKRCYLLMTNPFAGSRRLQARETAVGLLAGGRPNCMGNQQDERQAEVLQQDHDDVTATLFMDAEPTVLRDTDTIRTAAEEIMAHRYRSLPVVNNQGKYLGTVGVNGMLRLVLPKAAIMKDGLTNIPYVPDTLANLRGRLATAIDQPVTLCMETDRAIVYTDTPLLETLLTLYRTKAALPVLEKGSQRLAGVISYFDVGRKIMEQGL